jgi:hypothetical protein
MAHPGAQLNVLLICPWVIKIPGLQSLAARIIRVDFEAALRAAVVHRRFDVAFYAPTPGLPREHAETIITELVPTLELIAIETCDQIFGLLAARRS